MWRTAGADGVCASTRAYISTSSALAAPMAARTASFGCVFLVLQVRHSAGPASISHFLFTVTGVEEKEPERVRSG